MFIQTEGTRRGYRALMVGASTQLRRSFALGRFRRRHHCCMPPKEQEEGVSGLGTCCWRRLVNSKRRHRSTGVVSPAVKSVYRRGGADCDSQDCT